MKLPTLARADGTYLILDLNAVDVLADSLGLELEDQAHQQIIEQLVSYATAALSPYVSGLVLGAEIGFAAVEAKAPETGLLLSLTRQLAPTAVTALPTLVSGWSLTHIRHNSGALFTPLTYHPHTGEALAKKQLVAELADAAQYEGLDQVLSLSLYPPEGEATTLEAFQESQLWAARELQAVTALLALEYPHTALACATLTAELDTPWLLADRVFDYAYTKEVVRVALEGGARGCLVSSSIWAGLPQVDPSADPELIWAEIDNFLQTEARDRLLELGRIMSEFTS